MHISTQRHSRGTKLRKLILSDELKPSAPSSDAPKAVSVSESPMSSPSHRRCHHMHNSNNMETSTSSSSPSTAPSPDSLVPGEAEVVVSPSRRTHQRSKSDAAMVNSGPGAGLRRTGSNPKVEAVHEEVRTRLSLTLFLFSYLSRVFFFFFYGSGRKKSSL